MENDSVTCGNASSTVLLKFKILQDPVIRQQYFSNSGSYQEYYFRKHSCIIDN